MLHKISRSLWNLAQLGSNLYDKHSIVFMRNIQYEYSEYELRGNNKFCWVMENIMPQMIRLKNTSEGLVIP